MIVITFFYGLSFFCLGVAALLESRHATKLALGRQLIWLASFGIVHSLVEWSDMFRLLEPMHPWDDHLLFIRSLALPLSGVLLVRFGIGLIRDAGPLPDWMSLIPVALIVPLALLVGYAVIIAVTEPPLSLAADVWSRYLLYLPGNLLASFGFLRQWQGLNKILLTGRKLLLAAALTFILNGILGGLVAAPAPYGIANLLNPEVVLRITGIPVEALRAVLGALMMVLVISSLGVFEVERQNELAVMEQERIQAHGNLLRVQQAARREAEAWTEAMVSTSRQIADMQGLEIVLLEIVEQARGLLHADISGMALWDEAKEKLVVKALAGPNSRIHGEDAFVESPLIYSALAQGQSQVDPPADGERSTPWYCMTIGDLVRATAIVPLNLDGDVVGGLWVGRRKEDRFSTADLSGLERLGAQAVIAVEHAYMTARVQSMAIMDERARIAREMHDGLAQILGYLGVEMQALEAMVKQSSPAEVIDEIRKVRENIRLAHQDVRENILSLRTTLSADVGVIAALEEYVEEFGLQSSIQAHLKCDLSSPLRLSPMAEAQMVRIIQEALANVRKHADAKNVQVHLSKTDTCLLVSVADDGVGFEASPGKGHYGLLTMRERAESVDGGLTVTSFIGEGTQVELWLPVIEN